MKLYLYVCDVCGKEEEHPVKKRPPRHCRKIMRRKYTATPSIFKGDGWTGARKDER